MQLDKLIILFDAVGTLIRPAPDVLSVYWETSQRFGSRLSLQQVSNRFASARQLFFGTSIDVTQIAPGELTSSDEIENDRWKQLVGYVLHDVDPIEPAFDQLWKHFASPNCWQVFADVEDCWQQLVESGAEIGIASNFDSRLIAIARQLLPMNRCSHIFYSAEVGFLKPDPKFYQAIAENFSDRPNVKFLLIGDHLENDVQGPRFAGWNSIWLNRNSQTASVQFPTIRSLSELLQKVSQL